MVKIKYLLLILITVITLFANSCFIINDIFLYDSDVDERREHMNDFKYLEEIHALAPLNTGTGGYSFIVVTDTHIENADLKKLDTGLIKIIEENKDVKFIAVTGDITTNGEGENYSKFKSMALSIANEKNIPVYPAVGNHDLTGTGWNHWQTKIGSTNYRLDDGNTTIIFLDSANIYFGKKQLDWLENELKTAKRDLFIFTHVPVFSAGPLVQIEMNERARLVSMLKNNCKAMFGGHTHVRHTQRTGGVDYINVDSYRDSKAYCLVSVKDTGAVSYKWGRF